MQRRKARKAERMTPCVACGYPLSQRHHVIPVAMSGENESTVQLCANCHEMIHLMFSAVAQDNKQAALYFRHVWEIGEFGIHRQLLRLCGITWNMVRLHQWNGSLEHYRGTAKWFNEVLGTNIPQLGIDPQNLPSFIEKEKGTMSSESFEKFVELMSSID